jgi:nucleotide-binding universal stress UspA family protein
MRRAQRSGPVVVAVDGSARSAGAVGYAVQEARLRGSVVRLVHVAQTSIPEGGLWPSGARDVEDLRTAGERILDKALAEAHAAAPDVPFESLIGRGPRVAELVAAATPGELMVLGREARRGADRLLAGATTAGVAARARVPVAVVAADWRDGDHRRVVVGIKSPASDGKLLGRAFALASGRHAVLRAVHVTRAPGHTAETAEYGPAAAVPGEVVGDGASTLETIVRDWSAVFPDVEVETLAVQGSPAEALVDAAVDADVLMVARPHRGLRHLARLGRTPRAVLGLSDTPVEIVPLTGDPAPAPLVLEISGEILKD